VRHLNIQPNDIVLEVGFGPGLGLEYASENGVYSHVVASAYLHFALF